MLLAFGQRVLNEQIRASTAARERLRTLDGKRFAVVVRGSGMRVLLEAKGEAVELRQTGPAADARADVELEAGVFELMKLARSASLSELKSGGATLNGDIHVAEGFAELMRLALPEAEGLLADWIGDMPAHAVGEAARAVGGWSRRAGRAFEQNLAEYLQEEQPTLVPPSLARQFNADVDRLRDDVERAERRIERLERLERQTTPRLPGRGD